ncbi:MAG: hypothetical protein PWP37_1738 [Thermotogota bacterium]|nr:hypothetical protein [Thermotogota bacterium]
MMHWWPGGWWFSGLHPIWMIISWVFGIAVIVAVIWIIVRAVNTFMYGGTHGKKKSAEEILDERFARGEISEEEYRKIKETLRNH